MTDTPDPAKARFFMLTAIRIAGAALAGFGIAIIAGKVALPQPVGIGLFALGMFETLFLPAILARRWKS